MSYYKRIEKRNNVFENAPIAIMKGYETLKSTKGVIVSNDDNGEFLLVPTEMVDEFIPTAVSRADLQTQGFDADSMTDEQVQEIADKMGEIWTGYGDYWYIMDDITIGMGFEKKEEEEEED